MRIKYAGWLKGLGLGITMAAGLSTAAAAGTYKLTIGETEVSFSGNKAQAFAVNGEVPGPLLRFEEGEEVTIHVTNTLDVPTSVHWHGLLLPGDMDGVPGFNGFPGIAPGETFTYRFPIRQAGTYWYHAHSAYQEQEGVYGPLVIDPKGADPVKADREHVIFLSDWTDERGAQVHANLKAMPDYYNYAQNTLFDFFREASEEGFSETLAERAAWGEMRMMPSDIADVSGYTFLMNGQPERTPWAGTFKPHERVRLRLINGSAMTYFDFRIPGHKLQVVQADGQNVEPVSVDELRIAVAETYDVIVTPHSAAPLQLVAEAMDRSGFALGTLSTDGAPANLPRPQQRPRGELAMSDMGMHHAGMDQGDMDHGSMDHSKMDHSQMSHDALPQEDMSHTMDHGSMNHGEMDHEAMGHETMDHGKMGHGAMPMKNDSVPPSALSRDHELVPGVGAPEGARPRPAPVHDEPSDAFARHVRRAGKRPAARETAAQTHRQCGAGAQLFGGDHGERTRRMGLPLPPPLSHGLRHDAQGRRGRTAGRSVIHEKEDAYSHRPRAFPDERARACHGRRQALPLLLS
mgnify:CR=1 FL=1